jgi:predicted O-methyltransferase YrrM
MELERVQEATRGIPIMTSDQGERLYNFILKHKLKYVLELGIFHGVSTCYIAAALHELGDGRLVAVDNQMAKRLDPDAERLLNRIGLRHVVDLHYEERSYTWFLQRQLKKQKEPEFDFCYLDGAHTWDTDGLAFFLVAMCLQPGGWILFDDLSWSIASSPRLKDPAYLRDVVKDPDFVTRTPREEQDAKQVRLIWDLLVTRHPNFDEFIEESSCGWGFARKAKSASDRRTLVIRRDESSLQSVARLCRRVARQLAAGHK